MVYRFFVKRDEADSRKISEVQLSTLEEAPPGYDLVILSSELPVPRSQFARYGGQRFWLSGSDVLPRSSVQILSTSGEMVVLPGSATIEVRGVPDNQGSVKLVLAGTDVVELFKDPVSGEIEPLVVSWDQAAVVSVHLSEEEAALVADPIFVRFEEPTS